MTRWPGGTSREDLSILVTFVSKNVSRANQNVEVTAVTKAAGRFVLRFPWYPLRRLWPGAAWQRQQQHWRPFLMQKWELQRHQHWRTFLMQKLRGSCTTNFYRRISHITTIRFGIWASQLYFGIPLTPTRALYTNTVKCFAHLQPCCERTKVCCCSIVLLPIRFVSIVLVILPATVVWVTWVKCCCNCKCRREKHSAVAPETKYVFLPEWKCGCTGYDIVATILKTCNQTNCWTYVTCIEYLVRELLYCLPTNTLFRLPYYKNQCKHKRHMLAVPMRYQR